MPSTIAAPLQWWDYNREDPLARDLVGLWPMWEGMGDKAHDLVNGNHGTLTSMDPATDWVPTEKGWALDFDGSDDYINVDDNDSLDITNSFTIDMLFYCNASGNRGLINKPLFTTGWDIFFRTTNMNFRASGLDEVSHKTASSFSLNTWYHAVLTYDGAFVRWYIDGKLDIAIAETGSVVTNADPLTIGHSFNVNYFSGYIARMAMWGRPLAPSEIQFLYHNPNALLQPRSWIFAAVEVAPEPEVLREPHNRVFSILSRIRGFKIPAVEPEVLREPHNRLKSILSRIHGFKIPEPTPTPEVLRLPHNRIGSILARMRATRFFTGVIRMPLDLSDHHRFLQSRISIKLNDLIIHNVTMLESAIIEADPSEGTYLHRETEFRLPTIPIIAPEVGDTITYAERTFNVLKVREPYQGDFWGLETRELSISTNEALRDLVTLWPRVQKTDEYGSTITTHPNKSNDFDGVPGRIQLQAPSLEEQQGRRGFVKEYNIYVSADLPTLKHGDLLKDQNSKQYIIESWKNRDRIDEFSVILCSTPL